MSCRLTRRPGGAQGSTEYPPYSRLATILFPRHCHGVHTMYTPCTPHVDHDPHGVYMVCTWCVHRGSAVETRDAGRRYGSVGLRKALNHRTLGRAVIPQGTTRPPDRRRPAPRDLTPTSRVTTWLPLRSRKRAHRLNNTALSGWATMGCARALRSSARTMATAIAGGAITPLRLPKPVQSAPAKARPFTKKGRNWPLTPGIALW